MVAIEGLVDDAADDSLVILNDTEYVSTGMGEVVEAINDFGKFVYVDGLAKAGAADSLDETLASLQSQVDPIVQTIETMLNSHETALVEGHDTLKTSFEAAVEQVEGLNVTIGDARGTVDTLDDQVHEFDAPRKLAVLAIFAAALFCVVFGVIGVISYWTPCTWDDCLIHLLNIT
jgi:hypothetical protein